MQIRMALAKLNRKAGSDTGGAKLIARVGFQTLQQVACVLTDPSSGAPATIQNSLLMCLPCFATPRIFVATLKCIFDEASSDPQNDFAIQQKVNATDSLTHALTHSFFKSLISLSLSHSRSCCYC